MLQPLATNAMQVQCASCGATVNFTPPETATWCDFCGDKIVAQPKSADALVAPEAILPFKIDQSATDKILRDWINSRWFAPSKLKTFAQPQAIHSVYIPFWTYDTQTNSYYDGQRGEHYYETVYETDSNGDQTSREVQQTRWYSVSGQISRWFDDILVPATASLNLEKLKALEPWDLDQLRNYEPAYLAGHKAQTYQVPLDQGFEIAKQMISSTIYNDAQNDIGGDEQRVSNVSTNYSAITFKHLLLPVYAGAYRYNSKVYQIVVNGRTGEIQGERPYSYFKIAALIIAIIGVLLFIVVLFSLFKR